MKAVPIAVVAIVALSGLGCKLMPGPSGGGAHIVLRCVPQTRMTFSSPEDHPMVAPGAAPAEHLADMTRAVLAKHGAPAAETRVTLVAPNRMIVETRAADTAAAQAQQRAVRAFLQSQVPAGTPTEQAELQSVFVDPLTADKARMVIQRRLVALRRTVGKARVSLDGADRLVIDLPGLRDQSRVVPLLSLLTNVGRLEFRLIPPRYRSDNTGVLTQWQDTQTGRQVPWEQVEADSSVVFTGNDLQDNARPQSGPNNDWVVSFEMRESRKHDFRDFSRRNIGRQVAVDLNGTCQMAPVIKSEIPGAGIIEGHFTQENARDLALLLNSGALPVPLEVVQSQQAGAGTPGRQ